MKGFLFLCVSSRFTESASSDATTFTADNDDYQQGVFKSKSEVVVVFRGDMALCLGKIVLRYEPRHWLPFGRIVRVVDRCIVMRIRVFPSTCDLIESNLRSTDCWGGFCEFFSVMVEKTYERGKLALNGDDGDEPV